MVGKTSGPRLNVNVDVLGLYVVQMDEELGIRTKIWISIRQKCVAK